MTTLYQFGIKNYQPDFFNSVDDLTNKKGELLNQIIGKKIDSIFTVWSKEHNEEWLDAPIVLKIENTQLELCANKIDEFSITVDTINLGTEINWYGDNRFEWREFKKNVNSFEIKKIKIIELENEISNITGKRGLKNNWWSLGGLQFIDNLNQISIYNGFDTNFITLKPLTEKGIRTKEIKYVR